jgi:very-short-patch-repair endonuclease
MAKLCECGCGKAVTKEQNRFVKGHNKRGKLLSDEIKLKLSLANKGQIAWNKGIPRTNEVKAKISKKLQGVGKGKIVSNETRNKLSINHVGFIGKKHTEAAKLKIGKANKGKFVTKETRLKLSRASKGRKLSKESKLKISETRKALYASGKLKLYDKKYNTSIELKMEEQLQKLKLNYEKQKFIKDVGFVDFFLPEYDLIVECDGDYWHNLPDSKSKDINRDFSSVFLHKYKTVRFWEHEINTDIEGCLRKIRGFL